MIKPITNFAKRMNSKIDLDPELLIEKDGRYFLLNKNLKKVIRREFFYAGKYLGKIKKGRFFPSFNLLTMLSENKANKIILKEKASWLFVCGRDIFPEGISAINGSRKKGDFTLVLNKFGECLGFGRILHDLSSANIDVAVRNVSDVGDFLRRER